MVKGLPHEDFDDGVPANVELACRDVQFLKQVLCEVDVDSLDLWGLGEGNFSWLPDHENALPSTSKPGPL